MGALDSVFVQLHENLESLNLASSPLNSFRIRIHILRNCGLFGAASPKEGHKQLHRRTVTVSTCFFTGGGDR